MANGEPMNSLSDAKAVLAEWPEQGPSFIDLDDKSRREALSATIAEVESLTNEVSRLREALENLMNAGHAVTTLHSRWAPEEAEYYTCLLDGVNAARQIFNMEPII